MANHCKRNKTALLTAAWLVALAVVCHAQRPFQYKYTLADGLPLVEATNINFSKKGEAWASYGVGEYLSRFDGINWTHYRLDSLGLPSSLKFLNEDKHGIWFTFATNQAMTLVRFTPDEKWTTYRLEGYFSPYFDTKENCVKLLGDGTYSFAYDPAKDDFVRSETPLLPGAGQNSPENFYGIPPYGKNEMSLAKWMPGKDSTIVYFGENFKETLLSVTGQFHIVDPRAKKSIALKDAQYFWQEEGKLKAFKPVLPDGSIGRIIIWQPLLKWVNGPLPNQYHGF